MASYCVLEKKHVITMNQFGKTACTLGAEEETQRPISFLIGYNMLTIRNMLVISVAYYLLYTLRPIETKH